MVYIVNSCNKLRVSIDSAYNLLKKVRVLWIRFSSYEWNMSVERLTVFKSFRLSKAGRFVPERIADYMYQYLTER